MEGTPDPTQVNSLNNDLTQKYEASRRTEVLGRCTYSVLLIGLASVTKYSYSSA